MSSSQVQSKRKKDDILPIERMDSTNMTQMSEDVPLTCEEAPSKRSTPTASSRVLPPRPPVAVAVAIEPIKKEREYVGTSLKQKSEYWNNFKVYLDEEGMRRAECIYCPKTFAADPVRNGTKNVKNHASTCPNNPDNAVSLKVKQSKLILEQVEGKAGEMRMKNWVLNHNELREALCYMIMIDELPFRFVEKPGFIYMMSVACPEYKLPSRMTIARGCYQLYLKEKEKLKEFLAMSCERVSITTDSWTSNQRINYMAITAHFIDENWNLHKRILNFCPIASHKGEAIAKALDHCLEIWGLDSKLFSVTVDNASSNDVVCSHLKNIIQMKGCISNGKYLHMRCVAHIINLIVWDGLKIKYNLEAVDRVRAAVKFVRNSPARIQRFKDLAKVLKIDSKALLSNDCPTRWNSTYNMLDTALKFERVFGMFELNKEADFREPTCGGPPQESDWNVVRRLVTFLERFYMLTNNVSGSLGVTSCNALFDIATALETLKSLKDTGDPDLVEMANKMREKFDKYWGRLEKFNMLLYVAVILDPKVKMVTLRLFLHEMYGDFEGDMLLEDIQQVTYDLYDEYKSIYSPTVVHPSSETSTTTSLQRRLIAKSKVIKTSNVPQGRYMSMRPELERYLNEDFGEDLEMDVLQWWRLNAVRFPIISRMARDILAMPVSTVASESAFSAGGKCLDQFRSSLTPKMVQGLICGQDWLRASLRSETNKVLNVEETLEDLEDLESDLDKSGVVDPTFYVTTDDE